MKALLAVLIGALPLLAEGFLLLRLCEGRKPLLRSWERLGPGFLVGIVLFAVAAFLSGWMGLPIRLFPLLAIHLILLVSLAWMFFKKTDRTVGDWMPPLALAWKEPVSAVLLILLATLIVRFALFTFASLSVPTYQDDAFNNWNLRARVFYEMESLNLDVVREHPFFFGSERTSNYTPSFSLPKTWFALVHGGWHEGVINSLSPFIFLAMLLTLFSFLQRHAHTFWALLGVYLLASQPLVLVHGTQPYADLFTAALLLLSVALFSCFEKEKNAEARQRWLQLLGVSLAAFAFTKNEALLLYLPPLLLALAVSVSLAAHPRTAKTMLPPAFSILFPLLVVLLPWIVFKQSYGLGFGHGGSDISFAAFSLPSMEKVRGLLFALKYVFFLEGSWLLFFPLLIGVLIVGFHKLRSSPLLLPTCALLVSVAGTFLLYFLTNLGNQVLTQTGVNRGMLHLVPSFVFITTILLKDIVERWKLFKSFE